MTRRIRVVGDATEARDQYLELLRSARRTISISTWMLTKNSFALEVLAVLKQRIAERNIRVTVVCFGGFLPIVTGAVSGVVDISDGKPLDLAGIQGLTFHPHVSGLLKGAHEKLLVVDGRTVLFSDRNIGDDYYGPSWQYTGLDVVVTGDRALASAVDAHIVSNLSTHLVFPARPPSAPELPDGTLQFRVKSPAARVDHITPAYVDAVRAATHEIVIANCVFRPPPGLLAALRAAGKRGVRVTVVVPFEDQVSQRIHVGATRGAALAVAQTIAGARLLGYKGHGTMHHKYLWTDEGKTVLFGSYNMDFYSETQDVEYVVRTEGDEAFAGQLAAYHRQWLVPRCREVLLSSCCAETGAAFFGAVAALAPCCF